MLKTIFALHVTAHLQRWTAEWGATYVLWESAFVYWMPM